MEAKSTSSATPRNTWSEVLFLRIYKSRLTDQHPDIAVFANTRQRCRVTVALTVGHDGAPVTLTPAEIARAVRLIGYPGGEPITQGEAFAGDTTWLVSANPNEYEWDESFIPQKHAHAKRATAPAAPDRNRMTGKAGPQIVTFHVSTSQASNSLEIGAQVTSSAGVEIATTTNVGADDPGGAGEEGRFDSSVIVYGVRPPSLPAESYGDRQSDGTLTPHPVGSTNYFYRTVEHYLSVRMNGTAIPLSNVSAFQVNRRSGETIKWGISYCGQPGKNQPDTFPLAPVKIIKASGTDYVPKEMFDTCIGSIQASSQTHAVIGLLTGNLEGTFTNGSISVPDVTSANIVLVDAFGNDHALVVSFNGAAANKLTIGKG